MAVDVPLAARLAVGAPRSAVPSTYGRSLDGADGDPLRAVEMMQSPNDIKADQNTDVKDMLTIYNLRDLVNATGDDDIVDNFKGMQQVSRWLISRKHFDVTMMFFVFIDLINIALEDELEDDAPLYFHVCSGVLTFAFTVEILARCSANPEKVFTDKLMIFDIFIVTLSLVSFIANSPLVDGSMTDLSFLMAFRVIRMSRVLRLARSGVNLTLLRILMEAINGALQPLAMVLLLTLITVFSFAVMMTTLVPTAGQDGEAIEEVALHYFDTVLRSCLTLLEGMSGASEWGTSFAFILFEGLRAGKLGSTLLFVATMIAFVVLRLGLNGLVTAVFLEQLFHASDKEDEAQASQELYAQGELLKKLDNLFGVDKDEAPKETEGIVWKDMLRAMETHPEVEQAMNLTVVELEKLFLHLDEDADGVVATDEFIFAVFRLRAMSKSVDMLSIDYQQEQSLQRIQYLYNGLRHAIAGIQSRLTALYAILPVLEDEIQKVRRGMEEVEELDSILMLKRQSRGGFSANCSKAEDDEVDVMARMTVEDLRGTLHLNRRLADVEAAAQCLRDDVPLVAGEEVDTSVEDHIGAVASCIVQSLQLALQQELANVRMMAAEQRGTSQPHSAGK